MSIYGDIYGDIEEVQELDKEIKRLNKQLRNLRIQKKEAEGRICDFLKEHERPGFKHKNIAVTLSERKCRGRKNMLEKKEQMLEILRNSRNPQSDDVLDEILESIKGDLYTKNCIKIQKIKDI